MKLLSAILLGLGLLLPTLGHAVEPDEVLSDPVLEARARDISKHLRCLVCQNQSIDDSEATMAHDLRVLVRERLKAGDSDAQIDAFLVQRYGDFVLLRPPIQSDTWLLWFGPAVVLLIGGCASVLWVRRRQHTAPAPPLSEAERLELAAVLRDRRQRNS